MAFSPDGGRIVIGTSAGLVGGLDAQSGQEIFTLQGKHLNAVHSVASSPLLELWRIDDHNRFGNWDFRDQKIVSGSLEQIIVWDVVNKQEKLSFGHYPNWVVSMAFSPSGKRIVSGNADGTLKIWDSGNGQETFKLKGHTDKVLSVAFSPDGERIVSGSWDNTVKVWEASPVE